MSKLTWGHERITEIGKGISPETSYYTFCGVPLSELSLEELIIAIKFLGHITLDYYALLKKRKGEVELERE